MYRSYFLKKIIMFVAIFCIFSLFIFSFQPSTANAKFLAFGGLVTLTIPCTCTIPNVWVFYAPLYPNPPFPFAGALTFSPTLGATIIHPYFLVGIPTKWNLGDFTPGVQTCLIGAPPFCIPLPAFGHIHRVGTSG